MRLAVDRCLTQYGKVSRTSKGLVVKLVLAKGLSEKGLLLADILTLAENFQMLVESVAEVVSSDCRGLCSLARVGNDRPSRCAKEETPVQVRIRDTAIVGETDTS